ncbi:MAG TPA: TetR/AcrR family transcriptional regulator [Candidatus Binatia bacterium]|nr:TetR/AcrR family transcriptional regulator [Candidatus Binatia bacterium]
MNPSARRPQKLPRQTAEDSASRRIVTAARRHFFAHGFRTVTMDELAEEVGMSKKTLYLAFASKTDLIRAVLLDKFREVDSELERIIADPPVSAMDSLQQLLACMQRHTAEIQPPFVRDIRREAPEIFELVQSLRRELIQRYFGKLFEQGRRSGIFRKDISTQLMIEILLGATESIVNPSKLAELGLTVKAGYLTVVNVILEGVLAKNKKSRNLHSRR